MDYDSLKWYYNHIDTTYHMKKMIHILNVDLLSITQEDLLAQMNSGVLYTPNLDHLVKLQYDKSFYDAYQQADWVICDSRILYWVSKLLKFPIPEPIPGSSFFTASYEYHKNNQNCRIFLLGAADGIAQKAMVNINRKIGRQIVIGAHSPSFGFERDEKECVELVDIINVSGATVLLIGVGAPKQEKWIVKYRQQMPNINLFLALGATIDFEAGTLQRAPQVWQKIGLEWLFRFLREPKRLFRRYFVDDIKFFYFFAKQLLGIYKNPFV